MDKIYPALDVRCQDADLVLAIADDFHPSAVEATIDAVRIFFARPTDRDAARAALAFTYEVDSIDVPDGDWARRSQENLQPITIGRLTVFPSHPSSLIPHPSSCTIVIRPSMGFGTGHHATTQLCLEALQAIDVKGAHVVDAGTGSGILAIAAVRLGATAAIGIDVDEDAIRAARENLTCNPDVAGRVSFEVADLADATPNITPGVVTANLTGALLVRSASKLIDTVASGGIIILGGLRADERDEVMRAFAGTTNIWERSADGWVGLAVKKA